MGWVNDCTPVATYEDKDIPGCHFAVGIGEFSWGGAPMRHLGMQWVHSSGKPAYPGGALVVHLNIREAVLRGLLRQATSSGDEKNAKGIREAMDYLGVTE